MSRNIEVSEETYNKLKEQFGSEIQEFNINSLEDFVGKKLFIRTVTYHSVGKVEKIVGQFMHLSNASWVADSGRFMNAIKDGTLDEVEPVGEMLVNVQSIIDIFMWSHSLPTEQK